MNLNKEIKFNFLERFFNLFRKNKWEMIESKQGLSTHYTYHINNPSKIYNEREVKKVICIEQCSITGKKRGMIYYGHGSLLKDEQISLEKARLMIDGKL